MKRILSLVLVLALVLGMVPATAFAAEMTAGDELKAMGLLLGDAEGNLNEGQELTRAEMMVVLARMNGVEDDAKSYSLPSKFVDSQNHWASNYIAYAEAEGWTMGTSATTFEPQKGLSVKETATFLLRVLMYDDKAGDFTYDTSVEKAVELGLMTEGVEGTTNILRGDLFVSMKEALDLVPNGETMTLGNKLGVTAPMATEVDMKAAEALSHVIVEVELNAAMDTVSAADFSIEDRGGNVLEIVSADLVDEETIWIETEQQTAGKLYTLTSGEVELKFTGVAKDKLLPEVESDSVVKDNMTLSVQFSKDMDRRNAVDPANYTIDKDLEVIGAKFGTDSDDDEIYTEVLLTTSSQKTGTLYEVTVEKGVTDIAGNSVNTEDDNNMFKFGGLSPDNDAPKVDNVQAVNAQKISLYFDEESDLTEATAEDVANYTITNKTNANQTVIIESADLVKDGDDYTKVNLRTSTQTLGNTYEVKVMNVADKFGNVISSGSTKSFVGQPADKSGPEVTIANGTANDTVELFFDEELDEASAEDIANYSINNDLTVIKAELKEDDDDEKKMVELTTSAQKQSVVYKVTVDDVMDEFGNEVGSDDYAYFSGVGLEDGNPELVEAYAEVDDDDRTYVYVKFSRDMDLDTAEIASNYYFGSDIGYGVAADQIGTSKSNFKVRVNELEDDERYTLTVANVTDLSGNLIDSDEDTATFAGISVSDTEEPEIVAAVTLDQSTVKVMFNRKMQGDTDVVTATIGEGDENFANNPDNYVFMDKNSEADEVQIEVASALMEDDSKVVVLNLDGVLQSGHTYDLYVNACKVTSSTDDTLITDLHGDTDVDDYFDGVVGLRSDNALPLDADDATVLVGGSSSEADALEITSIYSTSEQTVNVKFNKEIVIDGAVVGNFDNQEGGSDVAVGNVAVDATDETLLLVRTEGTVKFEDGDKFILVFNNGTGIENKITGDKISSTDENNESDEFYSSTQSVQEPAIAEVITVDDGKLQVTFTKDMHDDVVAVGTHPFEIIGEDDTDSVVNVEFDGDSRNVVNIFFDNTNFEKGRVYTLTANNVEMKDVLGFYPDEDEEVDFSVSSESEADAPSVLEVRIMDSSVSPARYKAIFSEAVQFSDVTPFEITGSTIAIGQGYEDGDKVTFAVDTFVDVLEFTATNLVDTDSNVLVLDGTMTNKFGIAVLDGTEIETFKGVGAIPAAAIAGVTAPVTGATPVTTATSTDAYTATVAWSGTPTTFASATVYTATITITPKAGYTLDGVTADYFTVAGATATNPVDSGVVTAVFPETDTTIATAAIAGVTAPVTGGTPVSTATETDEYTATVSWTPTPGAGPVFEATTVYTATITITPKAGYTLTGVEEDFFTVTGAIDTNAANAGVVTAVFPETGE